MQDLHVHQIRPHANNGVRVENDLHAIPARTQAVVRLSLDDPQALQSPAHAQNAGQQPHLLLKTGPYTPLGKKQKFSLLIHQWCTPWTV